MKIVRFLATLLIALAVTAPAEAARPGKTTGAAEPFLNYVNNTLGCNLASNEVANYVSFMSNLQTNNLLGAFDVLVEPGFTQTECAAYVNLVKPGFATGTAAHESFIPYYGVIGNSSNATVNLGIAPNSLADFTQNSANMGVWTTAFTASADNVNLGASASPSNMFANVCSSSSVRAFAINTTSAQADGACAVGLYTFDRTSSSSVSSYINGLVSTNGASSTSDSPNTGNIVLLAGENPLVYSGGTIAEAEFGRALSGTDEANFYAAESAGMAAVGASTIRDCSGLSSCLPAAFSPTDSASFSPGFQLVQAQSCPSADDTQSTYAYWPLSGCATRNLPTGSGTWTGGYAIHYLWTLRVPASSNSYQANALPSGSASNCGPSGTSGCTVVYSSIPNAMCAMMSEISYSMGYQATGSSSTTPAGYGYVDVATGAAGSLTASWGCTIVSANVLLYATFQSTAYDTCYYGLNGTVIALSGPPSWTYGPFKQGYACLDTVVLPQYQLVNVTATIANGIANDYEPADGRTSTNTTTLITAEAALVHNDPAPFCGLSHRSACNLWLYTNPLIGGNACPNGIVGADTTDYPCAGSSANTDTLQGIVDEFGFVFSSKGCVYSASPSCNSIADLWNAQINKQFSSPNPAKLFPIIDMQMPAIWACYLRAQMTAGGYSVAWIWPDGLALGGGMTPALLTNQNLGAISGVHSPCN